MIPPKSFAWNGVDLESYVSLFVGIPYEAKGRSFDGADCVGLVYLFYQRLGVNLFIPPHSDDISASPVEELIPLACATGWVESDGPPVFGDLLALNTPAGPANHAAIWIGGGRVLHMTQPAGAVIAHAPSHRISARFAALLRYIGGVG